jgi:hypothetical protein
MARRVDANVNSRRNFAASGRNFRRNYTILMRRERRYGGISIVS